LPAWQAEIQVRGVYVYARVAEADLTLAPRALLHL
jgi:hypothetical protein